MALITWTEDLSIGIKEIDDQHKKIVEYINRLNDAMEYAKVWSILEPIIDDLEDYANVHFALEEKYFEQFHYEDTRAHLKEHKEFAERVADFRSLFKEGSVTLSIGILHFLKGWLTQHIQGTDVKYVKCFKEHGL